MTSKVQAPKPLKVGAAVVGKTSRGEPRTGRLHGRRDTNMGTWLDVNVAPKGKPVELLSFRPSAVTAA